MKTKIVFFIFIFFIVSCKDINFTYQNSVNKSNPIYGKSIVEIKGKEISSMRRNMETRQEVRQKPIHSGNFVRVKAPENFSLTENANEVISYFNQCESKIKSGNQATFDLSEINNLTSDAIAFFVAHFNDPTFSMKKHLTAKAPNDDSIRERLNKSGFLKHVAVSDNKCNW